MGEGALLLAALVAGAPGGQPVPPAPRPGDLAATTEQFDRREAALAGQTQIAWRRARRRARDVYRLAERAEVSFAADPAGRLDRAWELDLGLFALQRDLREAKALDAELQRLQRDRPPGALAGAPSKRPPPALFAPIAGPVVGGFGLASDPATGVQLRRSEIQILARAGGPARAAAAGVVRRVERAPSGGMSVVVAHRGAGCASITGGLRDVRVAPGDPVQARQIVGLAGRSADGAPIVTFGLWCRRAPIDPAPLFRAR